MFDDVPFPVESALSGARKTVTPDGLYTAATDDAKVYDIVITKELGFNMARKQVKVEPARWHYHCDRLGLLVWQDTPSGGGVSLARTRSIRASTSNGFDSPRSLSAMAGCV